MTKSTFIMVDGIDGSGKSTVINAWKEFLSQQGNTIFDLRDYWKQHGAYPAYAELKPYDFIFSGEPTYIGVGKVIREELIKSGTSYPPLAVAHAYALDRLILYHKILIPALQDGKRVIQDRGVSTSLCYQHVSHPDLNLEMLASLPGNALALQHRPDHLMLMDIDAEAAIARLAHRLDKQDDAIFEKVAFAKMATNMFRSPIYQKIFTDAGTKVHYLQAEQEIAIMKEAAITLLKQLFH